MLKMVLVTDKNYYLDGYLKQNLDILKKAVKKNWDGFLMLDGIEGSAKTTLAGAISYYLDKDYNLDSVVFTTEQFMKAVDKSKPGSAIHWDEFVFSGLSTEALNKAQNALIKKMTVMRKKRLYVILLMPWFFMMRPYFSIGRSRALIHTYTPDGISRGTFQFYSYKSKQQLYVYGKKTYSYTKPRPDFYGKFTDTFGLFWDEEEYDKKKEKAILSITENNEQKTTPQRERGLYNCLMLLKKEGRSLNSIAKSINIPPSTISAWLSSTKEGYNKNL